MRVLLSFRRRVHARKVLKSVFDVRAYQKHGRNRKTTRFEMITVRYFASLRETFGRDQDELAADQIATVEDCWVKIASDPASPPNNVLVAVNMEYADFKHPVRDGDEVAFFPPVTGG
jgi:molybdopterin synthase sulfur carrier subunit